VVLLSICYTNNCFARYAISTALGVGANQTKIYRLNVQKEWPCPCITANNRKVDGYWELAVARINATGVYQPPNTPNVQVGSGSVVVRFKPQILRCMYFDLGVGLAYFSKQSIAMRRLGSNVLFEDRFGLGFLFGKCKQFELGYRIIHYSNAYFASVNNGLNLQMLILGYWF
jgi:hypothetical protein